MKKLSSSDIKKIINEELNKLNEAGVIQASPKSRPPSIPPVARSKDLQANLAHIQDVISQLNDVIRAIKTGSGDEGMSSYYIAGELDKAVKLLVKPMVYFKNNSAK